ncbi:MAG TPA: sugar phosphate isomerase/epimerase family protein [Armatimonadota bacterium]|nr:sugar phosphate isomerase/epimerase family protein [Armatimonadota bacterium]
MADFPIACQTITWGPSQKEHFTEVFAEVAAAGFTGVEIGFRHIRETAPADLKKMLDHHGLVLAASHVGGNLFDAAQAESERGLLDEVLEYLSAMGTKILMYSGLRYESDTQLAEGIAGLNRAAAECREQGVSLLYHNHAFEFADDGKVIRALIKDGELGFCPDVGWVMKGGWGIGDFLDSICGRVGVMHFKDFATSGPGCDTVPLGKGVAPLKEAAEWIKKNTSGLWVIAEQDNTDILPAEAAAVNGAFLKEVLA